MSELFTSEELSSSRRDIKGSFSTTLERGPDKYITGRWAWVWAAN